MEIVGRAEELAAVAVFLDGVPQGPSALLLEGEAGIGKTTMWAEGRRLAIERGYRVLTARPAESEAKLSFAALGDLAEGVLDESLRALPAPQGRALRVALLRAESEARAPDRRTVSVGFLGVIRHLAASRPLIVAVDDLQWMDFPSARVLEFVVRRLAGEPVAFLVSVRMPADASTYLGLDRALAAERVHRIDLAPLDAGSVGRLVRDAVGADLSRSTLRRLHQATGGNPFYSLEIARVIGRRGVEPSPEEPLPVPQDLQALVRDRLADLPSGVRNVLLLASAMAYPSVDLVERCIGPQRASKALARAAEAGVVVMDEGRIRFTHPLLASVGYATASVRERGQVHRLLARSLTDLEECARHLALVATGQDQSVAEVLDRAAESARARGAPDAAAELAEMAARRTPDGNEEERASRLIDAAQFWFSAGETLRARGLLETLRLKPISRSTGVRALLLLSNVLFWMEGPIRAIEVSKQALAAAGSDLKLQALCHASLAKAADVSPPIEESHALKAMESLGQIEETADTATLSTALLSLTHARLFLGRGLQFDLAERAITSEGAVGPELVADRAATLVGAFLRYVDDFDGARGRLRAAYQLALDEGDESSLADILSDWAMTELWAGDWIKASSLAGEAAQLERTLELGWGRPISVLAIVEAHLGRVEAAREAGARGVQIGEVRNPQSLIRSLSALGFLELTLGDYPKAERTLSRAFDIALETGTYEPGVHRFHADLIEVLIAQDEHGRAKEVLQELEERGRAVNLAWSLATAGRCRALLLASTGDEEGALEAIAQGMIHHTRLPMPFELGRTLLAKGQIERRARRKRASKESLERSLEIFERLPAPLWAEKARAELRRVGLRPPAPLALTETEQRVAELASAGRTNKEIAAALFMTANTVAWNLSKVYGKLGVWSRTELARRLGVTRPE